LDARRQRQQLTPVSGTIVAAKVPMTEPTIVCPSCKAEIKLTESLAALLIESTRRQHEQLTFPPRSVQSV